MHTNRICTSRQDLMSPHEAIYVQRVGQKQSREQVFVGCPLCHVAAAQ